MKNIILSLVLSFCFPLLASAGIEIYFPVSKVKQGSLQKSTLRVDEQTAQKIELQKLKGETLGNIVYLYSVSPLLRKTGESFFEADAVVVFAKVPDTAFTEHKMPQGAVVISWKDVEIVPTEAPQELLFGMFEVPARKKWFQWIVGLVLLTAAAFAGYKLRQKILRKKEIKERKRLLKNEITDARDYHSVVAVWQKKQMFIREFPHLEDPFKELEKTLFKYQFKPRQTEVEKAEVMNAWNRFISDVSGGFNGI